MFVKAYSFHKLKISLYAKLVSNLLTPSKIFGLAPAQSSPGGRNGGVPTGEFSFLFSYPSNPEASGPKILPTS